MSGLNPPPRVASMPHAAMVDDPFVGRILDGRYRLVSRLANGGMGLIYLAEQQTLARRVAVKILSLRNALEEAEAQFRARFFQEAKVTSRLVHPNTIRVYDYGRTTDDVYYIVMEYLEGFTLNDVRCSEGALSAHRVIAVALQVCASLEEAHALGVIHRDLKASNIVVTTQPDGSEWVKVLDFGIATQVEISEVETQQGQLLGSPRYMSPEQINQQPLSPQSDIYSLVSGCCSSRY